jgi:hypothetical protein
MAFRRWFPLSLQEQAVFFANFTRIFAEIAASLGFTAEDIAKLEADNALMQYLAQTEVNIKTFKQSFQSFRNNLTLGKDAGIPVYMHYTPLPEPPIVPYGIFERLFKLADRIVFAKGYAAVIGAQLGILPKTSDALRPEDLVLKLRVKPLGEAQVEVRFVRGRASGVNLYFRRSGSEETHDLGRFFRSPAIVKIPLLDGKPERIYLHGRYLIGNEAVGNYSNIVELAVTP